MDEISKKDLNKGYTDGEYPKNAPDALDDSPHNTVFDWDYQDGEIMSSSEEGGFLGRPKGGEGRQRSVND